MTPTETQREAARRQLARMEWREADLPRVVYADERAREAHEAKARLAWIAAQARAHGDEQIAQEADAAVAAFEGGDHA